MKTVAGRSPRSRRLVCKVRPGLGNLRRSSSMVMVATSRASDYLWFVAVIVVVVVVIVLVVVVAVVVVVVGVGRRAG